MNLKNHLIIFDNGLDLSGIQLIIQDEPFLVIGDGSHSSVFERGLIELDIPFELWDYGRHRIVKPSGELYKAVGMGLLMGSEKYFQMFSKSETYNMDINIEHLEQMKPYLNGIIISHR